MKKKLNVSAALSKIMSLDDEERVESRVTSSKSSSRQKGSGEGSVKGGSALDQVDALLDLPGVELSKSPINKSNKGEKDKKNNTCKDKENDNKN